MAWHGWRDLFCYGIRHRRCAILGLPKKLQEKKVMRKVLLLLVFVVAGAPVFAQVAGAKAASQALQDEFAPRQRDLQQKQKEISIRRVMGASIAQIVSMITRNYLWLALIAALIAFPVAYYFMHGWLQHYTYRAELSWWIFAITGAGAIVITLLTISYQSIKAALANPVNSLRSQ